MKDYCFFLFSIVWLVKPAGFFSIISKIKITLGILFLNELNNDEIPLSNLSGWTFANANSPFKSTWESQNVLGGDNIFLKNSIITRTLTSLPSHYKFEMDFIYYVQHYTGMTSNIYFDDILVSENPLPLGTPQFGYTSAYFLENTGGNEGYFFFGGNNSNGYVDLLNACVSIYEIRIVSEHNASNITIKFSASGESEESFDWAIQNLTYYVWTENYQTDCSDNCVVCNSGSCSYCSSPNIMNQEDVCVPNCSENYFSNYSSLSCYACHSSCSNCTSGTPSSCISCNSNYYFYGNHCLSECPDGTYTNFISQECVNCDPSCQTCSGGQNNQCLTCEANLVFQNHSCLQNCSSNYYLNQSNNTCYLCDATCETCIGPSNMNCSSCFNTFYMFSNKSCLACDSSCLSCSGPGNNQCLICPLNFYFYNSSCYYSCPPGFYGNNNTVGLCEECDISCNTCQGNGNSNCTSCAAGLFYSNGYCKTNCSFNEYIDMFNNSCDSCHNSCLTCYGVSSNNCETCFIGNFLYLNTCISNCPVNQFQNQLLSICEDFVDCSSGEFLNKSINQCEKCQAPCENCNQSSTDCLDCVQTSFLEGNICIDCDQTCLTCNGSSSNNCLSCTDSFNFTNNICVADAIPCLVNQYWDTFNLTCVDCDTSCKVCDGPLDINCLVCQVDLIYFLKKCVSSYELYAQIIPINNPFYFILSFTPNITTQLFFQNLETIMTY